MFAILNMICLGENLELRFHVAATYAKNFAMNKRLLSCCSSLLKLIWIVFVSTNKLYWGVHLFCIPAFRLLSLQFIETIH